ncbi:protamine-2 (modular protein) [Brucella tritici]|uniref:Protamine-2 (Modular protein) n=1 Tax=Brucella tritici TaxID=94626 RepID=A0A833CI94_9HYPH|nr:protamine-2 (modular protein) [Brucella tritici]
MDRRSFLAGLFGVAGAVAFAQLSQPTPSTAGIPVGEDILSDLKALDTETSGIQPQPAGSRDRRSRHRGGHHGYRRHHHRPPRRHRRRVWRRVCERQRYYGGWRQRCYRRRVWIYL